MKRWRRSAATRSPGGYAVTAHAYDRMRRRGVHYHDLRFALMTASVCLADGPKWKVTGADEDGDALTCVVVIEAGVVVVTVF